MSALSEPEIKELTACLSQDPFFNSLLPFAKKNFGGVFLAKKNEDKLVSPLIQKETKDVINFVGVYNAKSGHITNKSQTKATNRKLSLAQLRVSILQQCPEAKSRLKFFNRSETKNYETIIPSMKVEEFKNFIKIFPPHDLIKFLNLSLIRKQIEGFQRQKLSEESYSDLLNYFKPYQKESVKKLLRPISPNINTNLLNLGLFKERMEEKAEYTKGLPDIVPQF